MGAGGEDDLIARHFAPIAGPEGLGLKDDAALLALPDGREAVLTADALVAGVHFFPKDPAASIAKKALGVNLSDLAAKGADPLGFLLTLALPRDWTESWLSAFCSGLAATAEHHGCPLLGGDTVVTPGPLTISITAIGSIPSGRMVRRTTARPGELIWVTGTIGDAVLGLALASGDGPHWADRIGEGEPGVLLDRYRHPQPRTAFARTLRDLASAAMDVSDGLTGDLAKLLGASGVGGTLDLDAIPLSTAARSALAAEPSLFDAMIGGGDDYEILFTTPTMRRAEILGAAADIGLPVAPIGITTREVGLVAHEGGRPRPVLPRSYSHV